MSTSLRLYSVDRHMVYLYTIVVRSKADSDGQPFIQKPINLKHIVPLFVQSFLKLAVKMCPLMAVYSEYINIWSFSLTVLYGPERTRKDNLLASNHSILKYIVPLFQIIVKLAVKLSPLLAVYSEYIDIWSISIPLLYGPERTRTDNLLPRNNSIWNTMCLFWRFFLNYRLNCVH